MRKITVYVMDPEDKLDWFDGKELAKSLTARFSTPSTPVSITFNDTEVQVVVDKVYSDIAIMGDRYAKLKKIAKKEGITIEQLLERGMKRL